jgi:hypothetical protein
LRAPDSESDGQLGAKEMTLHVDNPVVEAEVSGAVLSEAPGERETASGKEETPGLHRDLDSTATGSSGMDAEGYLHTLILKCLPNCVFLCLFSVFLGFFCNAHYIPKRVGMTVRLDNPSCTFQQCCRHVNFSKKFREIDRQKKNSANVVMLSVSFE